MSCATRRATCEAKVDQDRAWQEALALGWKPCPMSCSFGGGFKADDECDHVTCRCGFEFCWDCGVDRRVALCHDNRWHKPSCRYHTPPHEVDEAPRRSAKCPACLKLPAGYVCGFPVDDGYGRSAPPTSIRPQQQQKCGGYGKQLPAFGAREAGGRTLITIGQRQGTGPTNLQRAAAACGSADGRSRAAANMHGPSPTVDLYSIGVNWLGGLFGMGAERDL